MAGRRWAQGGSGEPVPPPRRKRRLPDGPARDPSAPAPHPEAMKRARQRMDPPKAPWHPLPLAELAIVLGAIAMLVSATIPTGDGIIAGFALVLLGTAEFSWREHKAGFRSHGAVLAAIVGFTAGLVLWRAIGLNRSICMGATVVVFLLAWGAFDRSYVPMARRAGPKA